MGAEGLLQRNSRGEVVQGTERGSNSQTGLGHWRSDAGRDVYAAAYAQALGSLRPTLERDVATQYGSVRLYRFGPAAEVERPPLLLLPGRASGAPMWSANIPRLSADRAVFAIDALGDAGMSVQRHALHTERDQAQWIHDLIVACGWPRIHLVGHSFGGSLAMTYSLQHSDRVASLVLLEPILVFAPLRWKMYLDAALASAPLVPRRLRMRALAAIGGEQDIDFGDPLARMIAAASEHYTAKLPTPRLPTRAALRKLHVPVLLALAARSAVHDSERALELARATLGSVRAQIWPGTTHSLPMERADEIVAEILRFIRGHDASLAPTTT